jgi:acetylornithine/N-succinyldiaminopimelate aminotransferase
MLAKREVSCFEHGDQGGTFNGNPLMCAVGLEILRRVGAPEFLANVRERSAYLTRALQALAAARGLGGVRGEGLLLALDLSRPIAADVAAAARNRGLLINAPQPDTLRFVPSLVVTEAEIDAMAETLAAALDDVLKTTGSRRA